MNKVYLFRNKSDNRIFISDYKPRRSGSTMLKNSWGEKYKYIADDNHVVIIQWKINDFKPDDAMIEVHGYEGTNELWDSGDDKLLGHFALSKDDCNYWSISGGNKIEISEQTCIKLFGFIPEWDNDLVETEI